MEYNAMSQNKNQLSSDYNNTISILNIYFAEWSHRDQLWTHLFKFYYAILIVILLPNLTNFFQIKLPPLPDIIFRITGLLLSLIFLYISLGYAIRLQAIGDTYQAIIDKLPKEYQRKKVEEIFMGKFFKIKITYLECFTLFLSLFIPSILLMIL